MHYVMLESKLRTITALTCIRDVYTVWLDSSTDIDIYNNSTKITIKKQ